MASAGPNSAGTGVSDPAVGTEDWNNPDRVVSSNNSRANVGLSSGQVSEYLKATNFGFALSAGVTISGIVVEIEHSAGTAARIKDHRVRIVKGGTIGVTDRADTSTFWPVVASEAYATYGSSSDLWGESWTYSDINSSSFGVAVSATNTVGSSPAANVDHIRITVYYDSSVNVTLTATAAVVTTAETSHAPVVGMEVSPAVVTTGATTHGLITPTEVTLAPAAGVVTVTAATPSVSIVQDKTLVAEPATVAVSGGTAGYGLTLDADAAVVTVNGGTNVIATPQQGRLRTSDRAQWLLDTWDGVKPDDA